MGNRYVNGYGYVKKSIGLIFFIEAGILGMAGVIIGSVLVYISSLYLSSITIPVPPEIYFEMDHMPFLIVPENFIKPGCSPLSLI